MRVILATTTTPFVYGGARLLVDWLEEALVSRDHEVEIYEIPSDEDPRELPPQMVGLRMWDFTGYGDRLIALRTPSYLVRHHSKVVWFLHHNRAVYDLWDSYPSVPDDASGREFRRMMFSSDDIALAECRGVFTNSRRVAARLQRYNGVDAEVLYPPLGQSVQYHHGPLGDTLIYVSRVSEHKRQLLAVQAMALTRNPINLIVAGQHDSTTDYADRIYREIDRLGLIERVTFVNAVISEDAKRDLMAHALGIVFVPEDEDSYGFVGLEAAAAGRPLVTTTDSGGVLELVRDGVNGFVVEPDAIDLAGAFDRLYENRGRAQLMGLAHSQRLAEMNVSWDHVVGRLLA